MGISFIGLGAGVLVLLAVAGLVAMLFKKE